MHIDKKLVTCNEVLFIVQRPMTFESTAIKILSNWYTHKSSKKVTNIFTGEQKVGGYSKWEHFCQ